MTDVYAATATGLLTLAEKRSTELGGRAVIDFSWNADGWWAIADADVILHKSPGKHWEEIAVVPGRKLTCLLPTSLGLLVGTDGAHLFKVSGREVQPVAAFEETPGRDEWFTPWGGPPAVRSLAEGPSGIYANVHVGGILRSNNGAQTWTPTIDIRSDVHEVITTEIGGDEVTLAAAAVGLATSTDAGASCTIDAEGLHHSYARAVTVADDHLLMSAATGPRGGRAAIYKRAIVRPGTFRKVHDGLPDWFPQNIDSGTLDARNGTAAFGTSDGDVYRSENCGEDWELIADDLSPISRVRVGP